MSPPPANAAPPAPSPPDRWVHQTIRELHATLAQTWADDTMEMHLVGAWAAWVMRATRSTRAHDGEVKPFGSYSEARSALAALTMRVMREAAGLAPDVRRAVWAQAESGMTFVESLLRRQTERKGRG